MRIRGLLIVGVFLLSFMIVISAQDSNVYNDCEIYGNCAPAPPTFNNNTAFVNQTRFWDTLSLGPLDDADAVQHNNVGGTLTISEPYLRSFGDGEWLQLDGGNSPTADIEWNNKSIKNVNSFNMSGNFNSSGQILIEINSSNVENSSINIINRNSFGVSSQKWQNNRDEEFFVGTLGYGISQAIFSNVIDSNDSAMGVFSDGVLFLATLNDKPMIIGGSPNGSIPDIDFFFRFNPILQSLEMQGNKFIRPVKTDGVQTMVFESNLGAAEGEVTFAFFATDSDNNSIAQSVRQIGKNNSASIQGMNSQIVAPKDFLTMPADVKVQFDNNTGDPIIEEWFGNITNCLIYEEFLQNLSLLPEGLSNVCDTVGRLVPQSILGDVDVVRSLTGHGGSRLFTSLDYITREGNDFNIIGGDAHIRRDQIITGNFTNSTQTICNFDAGNLCNFVSQSIAPEVGRDWNSVSEIECHSDSCANAKGGNLKVMCEDRDYTNLQDINISFWLTTAFGPGDTLELTLDDNLGNTSTVFNENITVVDTFNSFVFSSTFENKSNVTMCVELDGANVVREAWVDDIILFANLTVPGIINQTELQGAIWLGEDGQDPDRCGINVSFETNETTQAVQKVMELGCPTGITRIIGAVQQVEVTIIDQNITGNQVITGNSTVQGTLITDRIINRTSGGINMSAIVRIDELLVAGENISNIYFRLDGTTPMQGNANIGGNNITNISWIFSDFINWTTNMYNITHFEIIDNKLSILFSSIDTWFSGKTTDDLTEGSTNKYQNMTLVNETISIEGVRIGFNSTFNATYDAKADYNFGANNFNGSGNFTSSGNLNVSLGRFNNDVTIQNDGQTLITSGTVKTIFTSNPGFFAMNEEIIPVPLPVGVTIGDGYILVMTSGTLNGQSFPITDTADAPPFIGGGSIKTTSDLTGLSVSDSFNVVQGANANLEVEGALDVGGDATINGTVTGSKIITDTFEQISDLGYEFLNPGPPGDFITFSALDFVNFGILKAIPGIASNPVYTFSSDTDTGMYRKGADQLGFTTGGVERFYLGSTLAELSYDLVQGDNIKHKFGDSNTDLQISSDGTNGIINTSTGLIITSQTAFGSNGLGGLSSGDINVSTVFYDTLTAKSPMFMCSDEWCSVSFPKYQKTIWLEKDDEWNILDIVYEGSHYNKGQFWSDVCNLNQMTEDICLRLNNKVTNLNQKVLRDNAIRENKENCLVDNFSWDGECFENIIENVSYENIFTIVEEDEVIKNISICKKLGSQLQIIEFECIEEILTGEKIDVYKFKSGCNWNEDNGYYCEVRELR